MKIINVGNPETREVIPVRFINLPDATAKEAQIYVDYVRSRIKAPLKEISVTLCDDGEVVDVDYFAKGENFERIRRITLATWNDSKKAEELDRVKHTGRRSIYEK